MRRDYFLHVRWGESFFAIACPTPRSWLLSCPAIIKEGDLSLNALFSSILQYTTGEYDCHWMFWFIASILNKFWFVSCHDLHVANAMQVKCTSCLLFHLRLCAWVCQCDCECSDDCLNELAMLSVQLIIKYYISLEIDKNYHNPLNFLFKRVDPSKVLL